MPFLNHCMAQRTCCSCALAVGVSMDKNLWRCLGPSLFPVAGMRSPRQETKIANKVHFSRWSLIMYLLHIRKSWHAAWGSCWGERAWMGSSFNQRRHGDSTSDGRSWESKDWRRVTAFFVPVWTRDGEYVPSEVKENCSSQTKKKRLLLEKFNTSPVKALM